MKTLKKGITPEQLAFRKKYWWVGKKITCWECEGEFEMLAEDQPKVAGHYHCGALIIDVLVFCPNCKTRLIYDNPPLNNNEVRETAAAYAEEEERELAEKAKQRT